MYGEIFEFNSCLLAKAIQTKTCRQINEYIKTDPYAIAAIGKLKTRSVGPNRGGSSNGLNRANSIDASNGVSKSLSAETDRYREKDGVNSNRDNYYHHHGGTHHRSSGHGRKSRKQRARNTHFLAYKLHDAAAAAVAAEEEENGNGGGTCSENETSNKRKRKHSRLSLFSLYLHLIRNYYQTIFLIK